MWGLRYFVGCIVFQWGIIYQHKKKADRQEIVKIGQKDFEIINPEIRIHRTRTKVPDDENIDIDKIVKDDASRYKPNQELKNILHARKAATDAERKLKEEKRIQGDIDRQIQIAKNTKDKEAQRIANEKSKIEVLIVKHRPNKSQTPDEVD